MMRITTNYDFTWETIAAKMWYRKKNIKHACMAQVPPALKINSKMFHRVQWENDSDGNPYQVIKLDKKRTVRMKFGDHFLNTGIDPVYF